MRFFRLVQAASRHPRIAKMGAKEFRGSCGMSWEDDFGKSEAYDAGRELAHLVTFRHFEPDGHDTLLWRVRVRLTRKG